LLDAIFLAHILPGMKIHIRYLLLCSTIVSISFLFGCHKDKESFPVDGVTGLYWKVYLVQETNDNFLNPVPTDWQLRLNDDRTFSFWLGSSTCQGTYSWSVIDNSNGDVNFAINQWNNPSQSTGVANKLKNIVQAASNGHLDRLPQLGVYIGLPLTASSVLQFQGTGGVFFLYR